MFVPPPSSFGATSRSAIVGTAIGRPGKFWPFYRNRCPALTYGESGAISSWHHTGGMKKTTLYLGETEAEGLRRLSRETGKPQAELIRQAIAGLLAEGPRRTFHSMGVGQSESPERPSWPADELFKRVMGRG